MHNNCAFYTFNYFNINLNNSSKFTSTQNPWNFDALWPNELVQIYWNCFLHTTEHVEYKEGSEQKKRTCPLNWLVGSPLRETNPAYSDSTPKMDYHHPLLNLSLHIS